MASSADFSKVMHISLAQYIREKKLSQAAKDLVETAENIIAIFCKYGFDYHQFFTRVFSKCYEIPPSRYRNVRRR